MAYTRLEKIKALEVAIEAIPLVHQNTLCLTHVEILKRMRKNLLDQCSALKRRIAEYESKGLHELAKLYKEEV